MSAVKVNFEIGHEASVRTKRTPEGFTHDWEVFVRGQEGADISHFVEKVVFHLHITFPKPKRVVREPPFSVKESGYAGFLLPIDIHVKNKDEPRKIKFNYDLGLPKTGPTCSTVKDRYIFQNPNEEFKKRLLKGGGIIVSNNSFYTNPDQETRSRDSFSDEKHLISKPKLSSDTVKKHKVKEHKDDIPHRTSSFENLFGQPIKKPPKISPDPKNTEKNPSNASKSDKKDKERSVIDKPKSKQEHKEIKPEKVKAKEERDKGKVEKSNKTHSKESDKPKEKSVKRSSERPPSPDVVKKRCPSPNRRPPSPPPRSNSASSIKEEYKPKMSIDNFEIKKPTKIEAEVKVDKEGKEKKKKDKKSHDKDKERKEKKEHKKESHKIVKDSPKEQVKESPKETIKPRDVPKEKEPIKEPQTKEKVTKQEKPINKFSIENLQKTPHDTERLEETRPKDKNETERKHKHKKKDKKRDEIKEKHKDSSKEKKHKHEKVKEIPPEKIETVERRETPLPKERLPESASPISLDTASQCSSKSEIIKPVNPGADDNSSHSDSEGSLLAEEDADLRVKPENASPEPIKIPTPEPEPIVEPQPPPPQHKEKSKKHKDKSAKKEEKRRKRKAAEEEEAENRKLQKTGENVTVKTENDNGESSSSVFITETKVQDNGVSSSLGEDGEPGELSPDYMVQLRELQHRIQTIKSNEELERVVNLIAETGRYEVTTQTFDFDLCLLDRSTVQQLIALVGC